MQLLSKILMESIPQIRADGVNIKTAKFLIGLTDDDDWQHCIQQ